MNEFFDLPTDPYAELVRSASILRDYYKALVKEGFTEEQAFELVRIACGATQ